jgi:hypothetical protein
MSSMLGLLLAVLNARSVARDAFMNASLGGVHRGKKITQPTF